MKRGLMLGFPDALRLVWDNVRPLSAENIPLVDSIGRVAAHDLRALVNSPPADVSRKDGYAVLRRDIDRATDASPVGLKILDTTFAGDARTVAIAPGTTVRVLTGARIPSGADTIIAEEYARAAGADVFIGCPSGNEVNILKRGADVAKDSLILQSGNRITPASAGLLAAAGFSAVPVFKKPVAGIIGTGDEIVEPGRRLKDGELYASNVVTLAGWCKKYGMDCRLKVVNDDYDLILEAINSFARETDVVITSGGAWTGDRDMVANALDKLGWKMIFHRIRIRPGKAVGFGILQDKPVFILPGGPPSNLMGFLQITLPGLLARGGHPDPGLPAIFARLAADITDGDPEWTDFFFGILEPDDESFLFHPMEKRARLSSIANATAIAAIPEGTDRLLKGSLLRVQLLT